MLQIKLHPAAQEEAFAAREFITTDDEHQGILFGLALDEALEWVKKEPLLYRCFERDFRKIRVGKFHYNLVFRLRGEEAQILAVMHMSRKPGYWKERSIA